MSLLNTNVNVRICAGSVTNITSADINNGTIYYDNTGTLIAFDWNNQRNYLYGLPAVTDTDNGKILRVANGSWALTTPVSIYTGTAVPDDSLGNDGDIYVQQ